MQARPRTEDPRIGTPPLSASIRTLLTALGAETPTSEALDLAARRVFDTLVALIAGASTDEGRAILDLAGDLSDAGNRLHAFGLAGRTWPSPIGALATAALIRMTEVDDIDRETVTTPSSVAVPAALSTVWNNTAASGAVLLRAVIAALETVVRVVEVLDGPALLRRGEWPTLVASCLGAAAGASVGLGLDDAETAIAIATTAVSTGGLTGFSETAHSTHWVTLGTSVARGVIGAATAARGFRADICPLEAATERRAGPSRPPLDTDGSIDRLRLRRISAKPLCASKHLVAPIVAMRSILAAGGLDPEAITRIELHVPEYSARVSNRPAPPSGRLESIVSAQYQLALAALQPARLWDIDRTDLRLDEPMKALMARIEVIGDAELSAQFPYRWPARLVAWRGEDPFISTVESAPGDPEQPMSWADLAEKAERLLGGDRAAAIAELATATRALPAAGSLDQLRAALLTCAGNDDDRAG